MRVLVCGGRDFTNWRLLTYILDEIFKGETDNCIIQGGANGADLLAKQYALYDDIDFEQFDADWETHGKSAGPIRNQKMLDDGRPDLVIAFPGGTGTADMVRRARASGVETREIS